MEIFPLILLYMIAGFYLWVSLIYVMRGMRRRDYFLLFAHSVLAWPYLIYIILRRKKQ